MTNEIFNNLKAIAAQNGIKRMIVRQCVYGETPFVVIEIPPRIMSATKAAQIFRGAFAYPILICVGKLKFFSARIKKYQLIEGGLRPFGE